MKKTRSPRFPFVVLENAVKQLTKLHAAGVVADFPPMEAAKALDFASMHGRAVKIFAAFRAYGLIEKSTNASGNERLFSISEMGLKVVKLSQKDDERVAFLQRAALSPMIFRRVFKRDPDISEDELAEKLQDRQFTENGAKRAAKVFVKNREFAKLAELSELPEGLPERGPKEGHCNGVEYRVVPKPGGLNLPLSTGRVIVPMGISEDEFQLLMQTLRLWKDRLIA